MVCCCRCRCQVAAVAADVEKMFVLTPTWFGRRSKVDVSDDFVVSNIGLVEFQLRLWIAVIHAKGTFGHWNLEFESAVLLKFDRN